MNVNAILIRIGGLFLPLILLAVPSAAGAATVHSASCSRMNVQTAIDAAQYGDTVLVPAGTATWDTLVTVTKGISLRGAGIGNTMIKMSSAWLVITPDSATIANNRIIELSGFTFGDAGGTKYQMIYIQAPNATPFRGIKIHDNKFTQFSCRSFQVIGNVYGVIYSNEFDGVPMIIGSFGGGYIGAWATDYPILPSYGDANKLYVEDNSWYQSAPDTADHGDGWMETGQGCPGIVVRYNTWDHTNVHEGFQEQWDAHGLQSGTSATEYSTLSAEYYGNLITNWNTNGRLMCHRGSWLMMFNNATSGAGYFGNNPHIGINEYTCDEYAAYYSQTVWGQHFPTLYPQHVNNTYVWNNLWNGNLTQNITVDLDLCNSLGGSYAITENRDFYNYNPAFDGSTGVGIGSSAPTMNATPGVGYWVTNYTPANRLPSTMPELKTYTQAGRLYKCTAPNTWTLYYQPYTYPHPLRQGDKAGVKASSGNKTNNAAALRVLPNPGNGTISVNLGNAALCKSVKIFNLRGQEVADLTALLAGRSAVQWRTGNLKNGIYLVQAKIAGRVQGARVLLQK